MIVSVNQDLCKACGICGHVCPRHIPETIEKDNKKLTTISHERIGLCLQCGHCVAVCPNHAIQVESLNEEEFVSVKALDISESEFLSFLQLRRSVRRYKDKALPREIINRIIDAAHSSPTGTGSMTTGIIVIDNPDILARFSELIFESYEGLAKILKNPVSRFFMKQKIGEKRIRTLLDFVMPGMHWYIRWYREGISNEILRDCCALLLFHCPVFEPMGSKNCLVAAYHAIMMAQVMKIGTCLNDMIPPICNRVPKIKDLLDLSDDREVHASITMGYSKYDFKRVIPRKLAEVRYLE